VLSLANIGFCVGGLMGETGEMEKGILELMRWEKPSTHVDLYEITCKIKDVSTYLNRFFLCYFPLSFE